MKNDLRELIYGLKPMRREHPKQGESEWYYSDPRGASTFSDMKSIDVPSENSPNPFAGEIQDYLYDHDRDNYDALYGDALPPKAWGANNVATTTAPQTTAQQYPRYWETAADGKEVYDYVLQQEGDIETEYQDPILYTKGILDSLATMPVDFLTLRHSSLSDKYKHALINCRAAQGGPGATLGAVMASEGKEFWDKITGGNTADSSEADNYANKIGRVLGRKYPKASCERLVGTYVSPTYSKKK